MGTVGVRELAERANAVVADVEATGEPAILTRRGRPVAVLLPLDEEEFSDDVLAHAPEYVRDMRAADEAIARGERGTPLDEAFALLDAEQPGDGQPAA